MGATNIHLKDVARKAGVHPSTASLCLNNSPLVAERTRLRVQRIARDLGYRRHPFVQSLMRERRGRKSSLAAPVLGLINLYPAQDAWKKQIPMFQDCLDAARKRAVSAGFGFEEIWIPLDHCTRAKADTVLHQRSVSGVIFAPLPVALETLDWPWENVAAVAIGPSLREPRIHRVRCNHFKSMLLAFDECQRLGYRRIGLALTEEVNHRIDYRWLAAYLAKQAETGLPGLPAPLLAPNWTKQTFLDWVRKERPDVVIVTNENAPKRWLASAGISVPDNIGLVSLSVASTADPQSGIREHWDLQGDRAVSMVSNLLISNERGLSDSPNISVVDVTWNPGRTVRSV